MFPRIPRNTGVYTRHPKFVTATSGVLTRLPAKLSKNGMRVYTLSDRRSKKKLHVYTASEAKGLKNAFLMIVGAGTCEVGVVLCWGGGFHARVFEMPTVMQVVRQYSVCSLVFNLRLFNYLNPILYLGK